MDESPKDLLQESKIHGSPDYPIEHYVCKIPYTYNFLPAHWHEEFEITLITSGTLCYSIGEESFIVTQGDLLFVPPNTLHTAFQLEDHQAETHSIVFHLNLVGLESKDRCTARFIQPLMKGMVNCLYLMKADHPSYSQLYDCFQKLWNLPQEDGIELMVKSELYRLLYHYRKVCHERSGELPAPKSDRNGEKIKPALSYIREHYAEPVTIEELAALCNFSPVHFMNTFKKILGCSCMEYIIEYRISMASLSLKETDIPIMQIAMDHGFQNISYFNRTFRRKIGMTPGQYRKLHRG